MMMHDKPVCAVCPEFPFPGDDDRREYPVFEQPVEAWERGEEHP